MWSFHFISYPLYRPSILWMQSSPKCRFPWMSICLRFPLRQAPTSHPRSQRTSCLQHYNSLMFTQLLQGEKSHSNVCTLSVNITGLCISCVLFCKFKYMNVSGVISMSLIEILHWLVFNSNVKLPKAHLYKSTFIKWVWEIFDNG